MNGVRTFPADYFKHLCRLRHVELRPDTKLPQYFGHLTNNLIYRCLAPRLLKKLQERREERGSKSNKLRGTPEPYDENVHAPIHMFDEWIFKKA
jgi:hypothetical protein